MEDLEIVIIFSFDRVGTFCVFDVYNLLRQNLKHLGIDAKIISNNQMPPRILFNSQEDLNLYKISGNIKHKSGSIYEFV